MKINETFKEAKRLYRMGFAIHWLHPKSKRPVEGGWGSGPRKSWEYLTSTYKEGYNVGVRVGTPSRIGEGFLAVIDVDVKSTDKRHRDEALLAVRKLVGNDTHALLPRVSSGRGNGSRHLYCLTRTAFKTFNPVESDEQLKIYYPSKKPSKKEIAELTKEEINEGIRIGNAWEISLYSDGRQVVLPPSIHPDSGKTYKWTNPLNGVDDLPVVEFEIPPDDERPSTLSKSKGLRPPNETGGFDFTPVKVDLEWLGISDKVRDAIIDGAGVSDRSGYLLPAATALHSAGLSRDEILSVLTDRETFLGECSYDHAKTDSRKRAAAWLWKYTVKRVLSERSAETVFEGVEIPESKKLTTSEVAAQTDDFKGEIDWRKYIVRTGPKGDGPPKATIENVLIIFENHVGPIMVRRNLFAFRDAYSIKTPWGGKENASLTDEDTAKIKHWLGTAYGFEPSKQIIDDAITVMACRNAFDPVVDWLDALPKWDKVKRLDTWLSKNFEAKGDPEYLAQVFRKWMTAMVVRAYEPGAKFDWMPIFEGHQGGGKSSFGRILVGDEYFLDWLPNLGDKDAALGLQGMWSVEMGELTQFRKNELETIKAFVVRTVDKFRPPHGKKLIESPRRCVFFGTTNKDKFLRDESGNRRFKPLKVGKLNFKALRADRDQLFAEAVYLYEKFGCREATLELSGQAKVYEMLIHREKMVEDESDVMFEAMQAFLAKNSDAPFDPEKFRILELFEGVMPLTKWRPDQRNMMYAAKMLKRFDGEKRHIKGHVFWKIDVGDTLDDEGITPDFY